MHFQDPMRRGLRMVVESESTLKEAKKGRLVRDWCGEKRTSRKKEKNQKPVSY